MPPDPSKVPATRPSADVQVRASSVPPAIRSFYGFHDVELALDKTGFSVTEMTEGYIEGARASREDGDWGMFDRMARGIRDIVNERAEAQGLFESQRVEWEGTREDGTPFQAVSERKLLSSLEGMDGSTESKYYMMDAHKPEPSAPHDPETTTPGAEAEQAEAEPKPQQADGPPPENHNDD